jgi:hypothetical protein
MAVFYSDIVRNVELDYIADNANRMCVCSALPTTYTEAATTYMLAYKALTVGDGNGVYTIADGDVSGRKLTVAQQSISAASSTGTATYVALVDTVNQNLLCAVPLASTALTAGNGAVINAVDVLELKDASTS